MKFELRSKLDVYIQRKEKGFILPKRRKVIFTNKICSNINFKKLLDFLEFKVMINQCENNQVINFLKHLFILVQKIN